MFSTLLKKTATEIAPEVQARQDELFLGQETFRRMLHLERKRSERSDRRFVLMLLETGRLLRARNRRSVFGQVVESLFRSTRETDIKGWYEAGSVIGIIFTEIGSAQGRTVANALLAKVAVALGAALSIEQINEIALSFRVFPEDWEEEGPGGPDAAALYPEIQDAEARRGDRFLKRAMDIAGSLLALLLLSPVLLAIAAAIKLTSRGPALFRQERLGQFGRRFTFLKFRSMCTNSDSRLHEEYIAQFISGSDGAGAEATNGGRPFKITADPRITPVGRFLRKTSLDELPQFLNVLLGDMSLVGPRPPIPYEFRRYRVWHRKRLLTARPGITGLWQISGRSRVSFDEMVRMDLRYANSRSFWMDVKILLKTPAAVISCSGAY